MTNDGVSWAASFNNDFYLPKNFSIQWFQNYRGPGIVAQGKRSANYNMDVSARKGFYDNKFNVSVKLSDVFNTAKFRIIASDYNFSQDFTFKKQTRELYITLQYRFGDSSNFMKKGMRDTNANPDGNEMNGMDGM